MIKLGDFARERGVTDRQVQRLLKKYAAELEGLYERKGPNGTWLSDEACEILKSKMKINPIVVADASQQAEIERLRGVIEKMSEQIAAQGSVIGELSEWKAEKSMLIAEAEQNKLLLEASKNEVGELKAAQTVYELERKARQQDMKELEAKLEAEQNRKLTLKERFLGRKGN